MAKSTRTPRSDDGEEWFNPWRRADASLLPVVQDVAAVIEGNRVRAVQSHRREVFTHTVSAVVANLAYAASETENGWLAVHMPTQRIQGIQRYRCPMVPVESFNGVRNAMRDGGMLEVRTGRRGVATTIRPTDAFVQHLDSQAADLADTVMEAGAELIILSRKTKVAGQGRNGASTYINRQLVPYSDDAATMAMRADMVTINVQLAEADLAFLDDGQTPRVNVGNRFLQRHFNLLPGQDAPRFDQGGRLFGAFWSNLAGERRRASLRIDGEAIAEVDFNAMFTRLAYARLGQELDADGDPYTPIAEELGASRGAIKQAVNAFFFETKPFNNWPDDMGKEMREAGLKVKDVTTGVLRHLPALRPLLWSGEGYGFMRTESDILIGGMKRIAAMGGGKQGLSALPLHDAVLVARRNAVAVKQVLEETGLEMTGVRLPVSIKQGLG